MKKTTERISDLTPEIKKPCKDKHHRPTQEEMYGDRKPGIYQSVCLTCGKKVIWTVEEK